VHVSAYSSARGVACSDHRPVFAHFAVHLRRPKAPPPPPAARDSVGVPSSRTCVIA
jgi:hypothetical protein